MRHPGYHFCLIIHNKFTRKHHHPQKYLFVIIVIHIWALLEQQFGFWEGQYIGPSIYRAPFSPSNPNSRTPTLQFGKKKLSEDIMDRQEMFLGIILSHIWAFSEHQYGFWKVFYTHAPPFAVPFLTDKQKLRAPAPQF